MGDGYCSRGCGFESQRHKLDGHFSHLFVVKIVLHVWKKPKINKQEARIGPFKKCKRFVTVEQMLDHLLDVLCKLNKYLCVSSPDKAHSLLGKFYFCVLETCLRGSCIFFKWAIPGLFFFVFNISIQLRVNNFLPITGFEPRTSRIGRDRSTNWATTTGSCILQKK